MSKKKSGAPSTLDGLAAMDPTQMQSYDILLHKLSDAATLAELQAAVDDDFKSEVSRLPEVAQRALRDAYAAFRDVVKHRVKMEALAGKVVIVADPPEFPPATLTKQDGTPSVYCVIKGTIEGGEHFECRSSAVRITRHFQDSKLDSYPQRLEFYQESHQSMIARNAKTGTSPMWLVRRLAPPRERSDGIPF